jgi:hypothetical protein
LQFGHSENLIIKHSEQLGHKIEFTLDNADSCLSSKEFILLITSSIEEIITPLLALFGVGIICHEFE